MSGPARTRLATGGFGVSKLLCALAVVTLVPAGWSMAQTAKAPASPAAREARHGAGHLGIGREAKPEEIAGWDIDIRPDGQGLPDGKGSVKDGEALYVERCAGCHGEFGEGVGRWPVLAAGAGGLTADRPVKTIGSFWPYASTLIDYIRRAQPFGSGQSLSNDEFYAVAAYVLFLNDIVDDKFVLSRDAFARIKMPNRRGFQDDDRETVERSFWNPNPCMQDCKPSVAITGRARALDATPAADTPRREVD